ncbi:MAG: laccase domain-containing protein [Bacilli bacterium]|nr:laccase domain-containing protein [Bacilli bacterium]
MNQMKHIEFETPLFVATTFGIGDDFPKDAPIAEPFAVKAGKGASLCVASNDEIPLFFAAKGVLGGAKIDLKSAVDGSFREKFHTAITQYNLNPAEIQVYMGPCLTFSHTSVERKLIEQLMGEGYRAACKRTDGIDFLDVPVLVLMQCRRLGVPMANIHIGDYDTFENPDLLYSALRGDKKVNHTVAKLK